jgi:spoIIIJ-associated protein
MARTTREFEGEDLEGALRAAAEALGTTTDAVDFEVLEEGRRGVFGLGARRVRIAVKGAAPADAPSPAAPDAPVAALRRILELMGLDLLAEGVRRGDGIRIDLDGPDRDALTRSDGELLESLQLVLNRMGRRAWPEAGHVQLACEGYREQDSVERIAREAGTTVARTGQPRTLRPMNPFERRIVHVTIGEFPGLATRSEGEGFLKRVVVERAAKARSPRAEG